MLIVGWQGGIKREKRPPKGLLADLYGVPMRDGKMSEAEVKAAYASGRVISLKQHVHVFTHVEWHMTGYELLVDELERELHPQDESLVFADIRELQEKYAIPSAFEAFMPE